MTWFFELPPRSFEPPAREFIRSSVEYALSKISDEDVREGLVLFSANVYAALLHSYFKLRGEGNAFQVFKDFVRSERFKTVHISTRYDPMLARLVAISFAVELAKRVEKDRDLRQMLKELGEQARRGGTGNSSAPGGGAQGGQPPQGGPRQQGDRYGRQARRRGAPQARSDGRGGASRGWQRGQDWPRRHGWGLMQMIEQTSLTRALQGALSRAWTDAKIATEVLGRGRDLSPGELIFAISEIPEIELENVEKILAEGRKMYQTFLAGERSKFGEVAGYTLTSNPLRAVPKELADDELFEVKLATGQLIAREKRLAGKGAVVLVLDKSGSMHGSRLAWAKAVAFATYLHASRTRVDAYVIFYDSAPYGPFKLPERLAEMLQVQANGGTDIERAVIAAVELAESLKRPTSVLLLSDLEDKFTIGQEVARRLKAIKGKFSVAVLQGGTPKSLDAVLEVVKVTGGMYLKVDADLAGGAQMLRAAFTPFHQL
ncbi:MAG: VWA domain-containing protein [Thermoproteus sp.]